jgi:hypothetical protein
MALRFLNSGYFAGKVGIGTESPDSPLEIEFAEDTGTSKQMLHLDYNPVDNYGSTLFKISSGTNSAAVTQIEQVTSGGNGSFGTYQDTNIINRGVSSISAGNINFITGSNTSTSSIVMTIGGGSQKGNVGIGTESPSTKLHVFEEGTSMITVDSGSVSPYKAGIEFLRSSINGGSIYNDGNNVQIKFDSYFGYDSANPTRGGFQFRTAPVSNNTMVDAVRIDALGNVGIGTTSPDNLLTIESSGDTILQINRNDNTIGGGNRTGIIQFGAKGTWGTNLATSKIWSYAEETFTSTANGTSLRFFTTELGAATPDEKMIIDTNGYVGIGTTNPTTPLQVAGIAQIVTGSDNAFYGGNYVRVFGDQNYGFRNTGGTQIANISMSGNSYFNGGNVGINTTSPDFKLDVDGTFGVSDLPFNTDSVSALVADEITGVELVTNGDFSNGQTGWSFQTGWAVSNGGATVSTAGVTSRVSQTLSYVANISTTTKFRYKFEITNITAGSLRLFVNKPTFTEIANVNAVGKYVYDVEVNTGSNGIFYLYSTSSGGNTFQGTVTNVSVKEITPVSNQIQKRELGTGAFGPTPVGAYLPLAGGTMTAGAVVTFLASSGSTDDRLKFGTAGQMQLFHDGSDGYIINSLGDVRMDVNVFRIRSSNGTETMIKATQNDNVELYFNDVRKLRTTVGGVFVEGEIKIDSALLDLQENTDIDTGAEVVAQVAHATYTAAFFDFVVKKGTNVRSGTVYACHNGDTTPLVEFTETSTNDLGDTSDVTLSVDISGANMRLLATVASDDWSVKSLIRAI